MLAGGFQSPLSQRSLKLLAHVKNNLKPRALSESPSEPCQARTRDRAVTTGAQSHGCGCRLRVPEHRLRAYQPAHPVKLAKIARKRAQRRWRWAAHAICLAGSAPVRSVTHLWADFVTHANECVKDSLFTCLPQAGSPLRGPNAFADRTPSTQFVAVAFASRALGSANSCTGCCVVLFCVLRGARLFQAERPDIASCTSCLGRSSRGRAPEDDRIHKL